MIEAIALLSLFFIAALWFAVLYRTWADWSAMKPPPETNPMEDA